MPRSSGEVDTSPVGLARISLDGQLLEANSALGELAGCSVTQLMAAPLEAFQHPDDRERHLSVARDLLAGRRDSAQIETRLVRHDGDTCWIWAVVGIVRTPEGEPRHLVVHVVDGADRRAEAQTWRALAATDTLTGLTNRRGAEDALHRLRTGDAVVVLDLDHFKRLNDEEGHAAGDAALRRFATTLRSVCRDGDTAVRWGGEEFLLLLPNAGTAGALAWVERLRRQWGETRQGPTFSAGVCVVATGVRDPVGLADGALYAAKNAGRDCTRVHSHGQSGADVDWPAVLGAVLADGECPVLAFQPVVDLQRGEVAGYEALARFPSEVPATTQAWFDAADRQSVGATLQLRLVRKALATLHELPEPCFLSVNIDPRVLALPEAQHAFLPGQRLDRVVVELTGPVPVVDDPALLQALTDLRARGAKTALDEAGSGHAGLAHLARLRPDLVKLDRTLIDGCDGDPARLSVVDLLGAHAGRLDAWLVAEGIETEGELDALARLGVPLAQGFLFGAPGGGWPVVPPHIATRLRRLARERSVGGRLFPLVEPVEVVGVPDRRGTLDPEASSWQVRVDEHLRPVEVADPHGRRTECSLHVHANEEPDAVALRALAREPSRRLDPVVVITPTGRILGVLTAEGLLAYLASPRRGTTEVQIRGTVGLNDPA